MVKEPEGVDEPGQKVAMEEFVNGEDVVQPQVEIHADKLEEYVHKDD